MKGSLGKVSIYTAAQPQATVEVSQWKRKHVTTSLLTLFLQCIVHPISPGKGKELLAIFAEHPHRCPMNEPNLQHAVLLFFPDLSSLHSPVHFTDSDKKYGVFGRGGFVEGLNLGTLRDHHWIFLFSIDQFSLVQSNSHVQLFVTPWTAAH